MKLVIITLLFVFKTGLIFSWPGDQESLSCIPEVDKTNPKNRQDILAQYNSTGIYASNGKTKEQNQAEAIQRVKTIARNNHDTDYRVTKLGDSLLD